jgi:hypothetical protein
MFNYASEKLFLLSSGRVTLVSLILFAVFIGYVLPNQAAKADAYSNGAGSPDSSFFYLSSDLYQMARAYGEEGRAAYVQARFTFDMIWPLVYLFFLGTAMSWSLGRALPAGSLWRMLNLFPVFGWLFDMCENLATSAVMLVFPQDTFFATLAPIFTLLKWLFVNGSFLILIPAFLAALWAGRRKDRGVA